MAEFRNPYSHNMTAHPFLPRISNCCLEAYEYAKLGRTRSPSLPTPDSTADFLQLALKFLAQQEKVFGSNFHTAVGNKAVETL